MMLPSAYYLLFLLPPAALLTYLDLTRKGKIHLIFLAAVVLYYLAVAAFFGYAPYTPIWLAAFIGIGSLVALYDLGWADRIFLAASVIAVPAYYLLFILAFAIIVYYMDRRANKLSPKLSVLLKEPDPSTHKSAKYAFMPYLAMGIIIIGLLAPAYGYLYWSQINSISTKFNFTHGYNNYTLVRCQTPYDIQMLPYNTSVCGRVQANTVIVKTSNPSVGNCYYALTSDLKACNATPSR